MGYGNGGSGLDQRAGNDYSSSRQMAFEHAGKGDRNEIHETANDKHCGDLRRAESVPSADAFDEAENHRMGHHQQAYSGDTEPHARGQPGQRQALVLDHLSDVRKGQ
ncbi:hypothetical protein D9M70_568800 [compost metagenome]